MEKKVKRIHGLPEPKKDFESASERIMPRGYVKVSENIAANYGVIQSVILGILINKRDQEDRYHQLPPNGSFSISIGEIQNRTGISRKTIYKAIDILANNGFIEYDAGEVGVRYSRRQYRINEDAIKMANCEDAEAHKEKQLHETIKLGKNTIGVDSSTLWQICPTPLCQNYYTPIVKLPYPYSNFALPPYGKIGIHNRRIEAGIEAPLEGEKGGSRPGGEGLTPTQNSEVEFMERERKITPNEFEGNDSHQNEFKGEITPNEVEGEGKEPPQDGAAIAAGDVELTAKLCELIVTLGDGPDPLQQFGGDPAPKTLPQNEHKLDNKLGHADKVRRAWKDDYDSRECAPTQATDDYDLMGAIKKAMSE